MVFIRNRLPAFLRPVWVAAPPRDAQENSRLNKGKSVRENRHRHTHTEKRWRVFAQCHRILERSRAGAVTLGKNGRGTEQEKGVMKLTVPASAYWAVGDALHPVLREPAEAQRLPICLEA